MDIYNGQNYYIFYNTLQICTGYNRINAKGNVLGSLEIKS